jgi:hypothetical protein
MLVAKSKTLMPTDFQGSRNRVARALHSATTVAAAGAIMLFVGTSSAENIAPTAQLGGLDFGASLAVTFAIRDQSSRLCEQ